MMTDLFGKIVLIGLVTIAGGDQIFYEINTNFINTFCPDTMSVYGRQRSVIECASVCSTEMGTGFFFDSQRVCYLTFDPITSTTTCTTKEGVYFCRGDCGKCLFSQTLCVCSMFK